MASTMKQHNFLNTSTSMFAHMALDTVHKLKKERGLELPRGTMLGGMYVHKAIDLFKRGKDLNDTSMQKGENAWLIAAAEAARAYAQSLADRNRTILKHVLDFTRTIHGHPGQIRAFTITYYCDHSFPLSDCTRYECSGTSKSVNGKTATAEAFHEASAITTCLSVKQKKQQQRSRNRIRHDSKASRISPTKTV